MKMNVMLVDDEILVRMGVKSMIDWEVHNFSYIGDASDGKEALMLMEHQHVDILLTDIVMPNMNGLELIEVVRKRFSHTRIIVLSSHNEYDFVRKAMKLGVDDYLLKASMKPDELLSLLRETSDKIVKSDKEVQRSIDQGNSSQDNHLTFSKRIKEHIDASPNEVTKKITDWIDYDELKLRAAKALLLMRVHPNQYYELPDMNKLVHLLEMELKKWTKGYVIPHKENMVLIVTGFDQGEIVGDDQLSEISKDLISAAKRFLKVSTSVGMSTVFSKWDSLRKAYAQSNTSLQRYYYEGKESVYVYKENEEIAANDITLPENDIKLAIDGLDTDQVIKLVQTVFDRIMKQRIAIESSVQLCLELLHLLHKEFKQAGLEEDAQKDDPLYVRILHFEELKEAYLWFEVWIKDCMDNLSRLARETYREDVFVLIQHMRMHYSEELSLKQAAEIVNMNSSYLSFLFKKETGMSFTEYLNRIRIEKAEMFLSSTDLPSYLIAEKVGYENINYFGRVFKKMKGISPQQYRSQLFKKE
jgi:two-component system response regulator YesN